MNIVCLVAAMTTVLFNDGWERRWEDVPTWTRVSVPDDAMLDRPFERDKYDIHGEQGYTRGGELMYRKRFRLPEDAEKARYALRFDGVYYNAEVFQDGRRIGGRFNGSLGFEAPLGGKAGQDALLEVRVHVKTPCARWNPGAGINRDVWLVRREGWTLEPEKVFVRVMSLTAEKAVLTVGTEGAEPLEREIVIRNPHLWSPDDPHLYKLRIAARTARGETDSLTLDYGIRTIKFARDCGLLLNGRRVPIRGFCQHESYPCLGTALNREMLEWQLLELKKLGCNAIRTVHNPAAPAFYEICDRLGLLVMDETFDQWFEPKTRYGIAECFAENWEKDLADHVRRDRNHACVLMWSIGNEICEMRGVGRERERVGEWTRKMVALVKSLDPTRPVTAGCNGPQWALDHGVFDALDAVGLNYNGEWFGKLKGRYCVFGSETAATVSLREGDMTTPGFAETPERTLKYQRESLWSAGEFAWASFDYLGEGWFPGFKVSRPPDGGIAGLVFWPARSSYWGVFDSAGLPKARAELYRAAWGGETAEPVRKTEKGPATAVRRTVLFDKNGFVFVRLDAVDASGAVVISCDDEVDLVALAPEGARLVGADSGDPTDHASLKAPRRRLYRGTAAALYSRRSSGHAATVGRCSSASGGERHGR